MQYVEKVCLKKVLFDTLEEAEMASGVFVFGESIFSGYMETSDVPDYMGFIVKNKPSESDVKDVVSKGAVHINGMHLIQEVPTGKRLPNSTKLEKNYLFVLPFQ